jgi:hypothetical protein
VFSTLWEQLSIRYDQLVLLKPIFDEIDPADAGVHQLSPSEYAIRYPLRYWVERSGLIIETVTDEINIESLKLERKYEISNISKGASQIDITLIAYAKITGLTVTTLEAQQPQRPGSSSKYKIPLICQDEGVSCINFVELLQRDTFASKI